MKKFSSLIILSVLLFTSNVSTAQVYEKGNFVVDAYYGFPNLLSSLIKTSASTYQNSKVSTFGPVGIAAEFLLGQKVGLGIEATYMSIDAKYSNVYYDSNNNATYYDYEDKYTRMRILPRVNFHFGNNDKFDPYLTVGVGYANFKEKHTSSQPDYVGNGFLSFTTPGNLATRVGFGVRYFFTDHFGLMAEGGIGGPLVRVGLTAKF